MKLTPKQWGMILSALIALAVALAAVFGVVPISPPTP